MFFYKKTLLFSSLFLIGVIALVDFTYSQGVTEIYFTPFNVIEQIFYVLFLISSLLIIFIIIYNIVLHLYSKENADKLKIIRSRIVSATQGGALVLLSFLILTVVSGQMARLSDITLTTTPNTHDSFSHNWQHHDAYFQIPFGLLIEGAIIDNHTAVKNFSVALSHTKRADKEVQRIHSISNDIINFLEKKCDVGSSVIFTSTSSYKINVFADPINLITAMAYLDEDIYSFRGTDEIDINNWQDGDIIIGGPNALGGLSSSHFNNIMGVAVRIYGEDRISTEMALRLAVRYDEDDNRYGSITTKYDNIAKPSNLKTHVSFHYNPTTPSSCPFFSPVIRRAEASIFINRQSKNINIVRRGLLILKEELPLVCPRETMWIKTNDGNWVVRCGDSFKDYLDNISSVYQRDIITSPCPSLSLCTNNICQCYQDDFCPAKEEECQIDDDCLGLSIAPLPISTISYYNISPESSLNSCDSIYLLQQELKHYTDKVKVSFEHLYNSKQPIEDSLYQLFKATTLLSLFSDSEELTDYADFNNIRSHHPEQQDIFVFTFNDEYYEKYYQENDVITATKPEGWGRWVINGKPQIEYIETQNDPATLYIKMDNTNNGYWNGSINNRIKSALRLSLAVKEEGGLQFAEDMDFLDELFPPPPRDDFQSMHPPVDPETTRVSSYFRVRRFPIPGFHRGIDFARNNTRQAIHPIYAVERGRVIHSGPAGNYGQLIIIQHHTDDIIGLENDIRTYYGHLATGSLRVKKGDLVERGERIAVMGTTGFSTGIHLHFEVREKDFSWGSQVDPFMESKNLNNVHYINPLLWINLDTSSSRGGIFLADIFSFLSVASAQESPSSLLLRCVEKKSKEEVINTQENCYRAVSQCIQEEDIPVQTANNLSASEINSIISACDLSFTDIMMPSQTTPLKCGQEIPLGEAFEITWSHLSQILNNIDFYTGKGQEYLLKQQALTRMISQCSYNQNSLTDIIDFCPNNYEITYTDKKCQLNEDCLSGLCDILEDSAVTGYCIKEELCCPLHDIKELQQDILLVKQELEEVKEIINTLTYGLRNEKSENICKPFYSDIITEQESNFCNINKELKITKEEVVRRKLYLSRSQFDLCSATLREDSSTVSIIAPIAEKNDFIRKVKKAPIITTSCCCPSLKNVETSSFCPDESPYIINRSCTVEEKEAGCSNVLTEKIISSSNFNWFCCNK